MCLLWCVWYLSMVADALKKYFIVLLACPTCPTVPRTLPLQFIKLHFYLASLHFHASGYCYPPKKNGSLLQHILSPKVCIECVCVCVCVCVPQGDKTCRQCIKFDLFCHVGGDKTYRGDKTCDNICHSSRNLVFWPHEVSAIPLDLYMLLN